MPIEWVKLFRQGWPLLRTGELEAQWPDPGRAQVWQGVSKWQFCPSRARHPPTDFLTPFWLLLAGFPLPNLCKVCAPGPEGADGNCKNLRREEHRSTQLKAAWSLAASQTDLHRVLGPPDIQQALHKCLDKRRNHDLQAGCSGEPHTRWDRIEGELSWPLGPLFTSRPPPTNQPPVNTSG